MERVLVTGAAGQVGGDLLEVLAGTTPSGGRSTNAIGGAEVRSGEFDVMGLDRRGLDVTNEAAVAEAVATYRPDVIVHLAAYTAVDRAESDPEGADAANHLATRFVAAGAEAVGAHLVYVSTDYVFAGDLGRPLDEDDPTGPRSVYGLTKLAGEAECPPDASVVRTAWVAGRHGKGVIHLAVRAAREGLSLRFVDDQIGSFTAAADLAAGLSFFVRERPAGIFHVAGSGHASWHEVISAAVVSAGGSTDQVSAIPTSALDPQPLAERPAFSPLISKRLSEVGGRPLPEWQDGLQRLVDAIVKGESP